MADDLRKSRLNMAVSLLSVFAPAGAHSRSPGVQDPGDRSGRRRSNRYTTEPLADAYDKLLRSLFQGMPGRILLRAVSVALVFPS
jgi:hypothetical protein